MKTFEQGLSEVEWTEVLDGGIFLAFDLVAAPTVQVLFTESAAQPLAATVGNAVQSFPAEWDFEASDMEGGTQRIWARGANTVRGIRG